MDSTHREFQKFEILAVLTRSHKTRFCDWFRLHALPIGRPTTEFSILVLSISIVSLSSSTITLGL